MSELEKPPSSPENILIAEAFGHLFPGNELTDLPLQSIQTASYLLENVLAIRQIHHGLLYDGFLSDTGYAERENLPHPNQFVMSALLRNARVREARIRGTRFEEHSFADLVQTDQGESLGGAVERPFSSMDSVYMKPVMVLTRQNPDYREPLILMGVLNREKKPAGIISFVEPRFPRTPKRKEPVALRLARTPQLRSSPI